MRKVTTQTRQAAARSHAGEASVLTSAPDIDRARAFVEQVAASVDARAWAFARYDGNGNAVETIVTEDDAPADVPLADWLRVERALQSGRPAPRIGRAAIPTTPFRSALSIVYGRDEAVRGLLILLRTQDQTGFSSADESYLRTTLDHGSAILDQLRIFDGEQTAKERAKQRALSAQFILREDLTIEYAWLPPPELGDEVVQTLLSTAADRLPEAIESSVRSIVAEWGTDTSTETVGVAVPLPFLLVRAVLLSGEKKSRIGVQIERFRARNAMSWASRRFHMSPRELQIMALVLQGIGTQEIADSLHIAGSTAHDHIKRMLLKTKSRNRVEMVSKVLGWRALG